MAENKKSFLAYVDWKDTFDALPDEIAGKLVKHLFAYVSDEQPESNDVVINAVFANIKNTLKRDLKKWEKQQEQRVEAGRKSAENRKAALNEFKQASTTVERPLNENEQASTVSDSVSVSVSVSDSVTIKNLIKIKGEIFQKKPSEILQEEYRQMYEGLLMGKLKGCDQILLLQRFDDEYPNYEFKDQNHFSNALKSTFDKLKKEKIPPKNFTNGKQESKLDSIQESADYVLKQRGIDPTNYLRPLGD